jgi:hypothetical protein
MENRLATAPNGVDVGRSMIIRIDHNPQPVESENHWHKSILAGFLSAWVGKQLAHTTAFVHCPVTHAGEVGVSAAMPVARPPALPMLNSCGDRMRLDFCAPASFA